MEERESEASRMVRLAIIEARKARHLTQQELSERTGIAQTEISRLENGTRNPSVKILERIADGLGMRLRIALEG